MRTLADWIAAHPQVTTSMFEKNYRKQTGSGRYEDLCGFCLASHLFRGKPPILCKFCKAPIRETRSISDLPEVLNQQWRLVEHPRRGRKQKSLRSQKHSQKAMPVTRHPKAKNLATLSPYEEKCWVFAFNYYLDRGKSRHEADKLAWRDMQLEFPHLRRHDGCKP